MPYRKYTQNPANWKHPLPTIRKHSKYIRKHGKCRTKLGNYIDEKYDQVAIKYLKEKILNEVKQKISPSYQEVKIKAELAKSLREQIGNLQIKISFLRKEMKEKNILLKMIIHSKGSPQEMTLSSPIYRQCQCKNASENTPFHEQNMPEPFQDNLLIPATETQIRIIAQI